MRRIGAEGISKRRYFGKLALRAVPVVSVLVLVVCSLALLKRDNEIVIRETSPDASPIVEQQPSSSLATTSTTSTIKAIVTTSPNRAQDLRTGEGAANRGAPRTQDARPSTSGTPASTTPPPRVGAQTSTRVFRTTGYGYPDNDPPGSAAIARPIVHKTAGGLGTYENPITVAVKMGGELKPGDRVYIPDLRRYGIVEDWCGACSGSMIDIWVGGNGSNNAAVLSCEMKITGSRNVILYPPTGLPVEAGDVVNSSYCRK